MKQCAPGFWRQRYIIVALRDVDECDASLNVDGDELVSTARDALFESEREEWPWTRVNAILARAHWFRYQPCK